MIRTPEMSSTLVWGAVSYRPHLPQLDSVPDSGIRQPT